MRLPGARSATTVLAAIVVIGLLLMPNRLDQPVDVWLMRLPLELAVLTGLLVISGTLGRRLRLILTIAITLLAVLKLADMACHMAYARPFNPVLDVGLFWAVFDTLSGVLGAPAVYLLTGAVVLLMVGLFYVVRFSVEALGRWAEVHRLNALTLAAGLAVAWAGLAVAGSTAAVVTPSRLIAEHALSIGAGLQDVREFRRLEAEDAWRDVAGTDMLQRLAGKDVLVIFVESYGRTVLDRPDYAGTIRPLLEAATDGLAASGLSARSAFLTSPTVGGISWLAHGTAMSGLWVDNQRRYDSLVSGERMTLNKAFRKAGWRTVAVMPAIQLAWPEGAFYGYDVIYAAKDLGYRGRPFNWVTMPDQYTLSALDRLERGPGPRPAVMAEVALISSHAPWTPVPDLVDWDVIGDGAGVFDAMAEAGDPPSVVWKDPDRVRLQFRLAIEYALKTVVSYAERNAADDLVILVFGDHQPAPLVTGETTDRSVPVHLIARDPAVLDAVADWGWTPGMLPADDAPVWRMDALRDRFLAAFSIAD